MPVQLDLVSTKFSHKSESKESGTRIHGSVGIARTLKVKYPKITPRASVTNTNYSLKTAQILIEQF